MDLKAQLPVIVRYALVTLFTYLGAHGVISDDANTILSNNLDALVGAIGVVLTLIYALWKRPSSKALEVAKQVDNKVPKTQDVTIKTPGTKPDIVVPAK